MTGYILQYLKTRKWVLQSEEIVDLIQSWLGFQKFFSDNSSEISSENGQENREHQSDYRKIDDSISFELFEIVNCDAAQNDLEKKSEHVVPDDVV